MEQGQGVRAARSPPIRTTLSEPIANNELARPSVRTVNIDRCVCGLCDKEFARGKQPEVLAFSSEMQGPDGNNSNAHLYAEA